MDDNAQWLEAIGYTLDSEKKRVANRLINSLFYYVPQNDSYKLKYPDTTEYTREALEQMAGLK